MGILAGQEQGPGCRQGTWHGDCECRRRRTWAAELHRTQLGLRHAGEHGEAGSEQ